MPQKTSHQTAPLMSQEDATFLQASADAILHRIHKLRREEPHALNPQASPFTPTSTSSSTKDLCLATTTAEVHTPPQEVPLTTRDEESQPISATQETDDLPSNPKSVRWKPEPPTIHHIEADGEQKPTSATMLQQKEHASKRRSWCTNRSKRYRDQLVDWVITMHQLDALNSHREPNCPSLRLILHKPKGTILQRPLAQSLSAHHNQFRQEMPSL